MGSLPLSTRASLWFKRNFALRVNRWFHSNLGRWEYNRNGIKIFEEDWDNLYILDACRYDTFKKLHDLPGKLSKRESYASTTPEFLRANISGADLRDTVYITAQPQIYNHDDINSSFHCIVGVWKDAWDNNLGTVLPKNVATATIEAAEQYPDKRLLVHFLQPHYPFIGEIGREAFDYRSVGLGPGGGDEPSEKFWDTVAPRSTISPRRSSGKPTRRISMRCSRTSTNC